MDAPRTLGEYIRRLRRDRKMSLLQLAESTSISYTHLSRIENDSTVPGADTIAKIAEALAGDLKEMLAKAGALPQVILDRMAENATDRNTTKMLRATNAKEARDTGREPREWLVEALQRDFALPLEQARELAGAVEQMAALPPDQRTNLVSFIHGLEGGASGRR